MTNRDQSAGGTSAPSSPERGESVIETLQRLAAEQGNVSSTGSLTARPAPIEEKIEKARKQQIENNNREKDQELKEETLKKLFIFLTAETVVIFMLAFLQGFKHWTYFNLDGLSFRLVITATLGQITAMLVIAVQHLFPKKK